MNERNQLSNKLFCWWVMSEFIASEWMVGYSCRYPSSLITQLFNLFYLKASIKLFHFRECMKCMKREGNVTNLMLRYQPLPLHSSFIHKTIKFNCLMKEEKKCSAAINQMKLKEINEMSAANARTECNLFLQLRHAVAEWIYFWMIMKKEMKWTLAAPSEMHSLIIKFISLHSVRSLHLIYSLCFRCAIA